MRLTPLAFAAVLAACSGGTSGKLAVSTKVAAGTGVTAAAASAPGTGALTIGTHTVTLDRVRILVRKVALEAESGSDGSSSSNAPATTSPTTAAATGSSPSADTSGDAGAAESDAPGDTAVRWGPFVVDLSGAQLAGSLSLLFDQPVPAGTYEQLEFQVHKLTPGESVTDPAFAPLGDSVILDLTVDGKATTFSSGLTAAAEIEGPFTVATGADVNVTVTIDPSGWFTAPDGSFLDPGVDANRTQIEQNLRSSIRGFEDDDHDGQPDHAS